MSWFYLICDMLINSLVNSVEDYMLPCLNKKLFGFECLGCGLQRSAYLLCHGNFITAFKMYPAIYPLIFLFIYIGINFFYKFKRANKIINLLAVLTVVTIVISYIIKLIN